MQCRNRVLAFLLGVVIFFAFSSAAFAAAPQSQNETSEPVRFEIAPSTVSSPFPTMLNSAAQDGLAPPRALPSSIPLLVIVSDFAPDDHHAVSHDYSLNGYLRWPWKYYDASEWSGMFFGQSGSVMDYYSKMSAGRFTFKPAAESDDRFGGAESDGVVFVTIENNHPAYDAKYNRWLDGRVYPGEESQTDSYIGYSVKAAIETAASCGYVDFSQYDKNGDGKIDRTELIVYNIIAGYENMKIEPAAAPAVYAHQSTISAITTTYDSNTGAYSIGEAANVGVNGANLYLDNYMITGERNAAEQDQYEPFYPPVYSIMAHELGHSLGLPDLYDTSDNAPPSPRVGSLSNMANCYGRTYDPNDPDNSTIMPTALDAWCRAYLGFQTPETAQPGLQYTLHALGSTSPYNILKIETASPDEYYLLENRQYAEYDRGLEAEYLYAAVERDEPDYQPGVVIWRIRSNIVSQYLRTNSINSHVHDYGVMPVCLNNVSEKPFRVNAPEHVFTFYYGGSQYGRIVIGSPSGNDMNVSYTLERRNDPSPSAGVNSGDSSVLADVSSVTAADGSSPIMYAPLSSGSKNYNDLLRATQGGGVIAAYEISAADGDSPFAVSIHLGSAYAGEQISILCKTKSGSIERCSVTADENGVVKLKRNGLTYCMLVRSVAAVPSVPATGDAPAASYLSALSCIFLLLCIMRKPKRAYIVL